MHRPFAFAVAAVVVGAQAGAAQCNNAPLVARQGCHASVDLVNYLTPQLATALAGGSSTLGQSGALGGFGHFALSIRGTGVINGAFPEIDEDGFRTDGQPQSYAVKDQIIPGAGVDASLGIWKGLNLGASRVGGLDVIVSALYVPDNEGEGGDFSITANDGNLKLGYGVRIGVLEESIITPGVAISFLKRDLPAVSLTGTSGSGSGAGEVQGTFALNDFSVKTSAWRLTAAKTFLVLGLQAGIGQDTYESSANIVTTVSGQTATGAASMKMTRNNMFVGALLNLWLVKVVAEAGQVTGGSLPTPFNTFTKAADESRTYLSGGIRISF